MKGYFSTGFMLIGAVMACSATDMSRQEVVFCGQDPSALSVHVRDSLTGVFIGSSTTITATTAISSITVSSAPGTDTSAKALPGSPGTYTVIVRKAGYRDWTKSGIQVPAVAAGACKGNPQTVEVAALLVPVS